MFNNQCSITNAQQTMFSEERISVEKVKLNIEYCLLNIR